VRDDASGTYMHHKVPSASLPLSLERRLPTLILFFQFCIIDSYLLMNGSFNWSRQAVVGNQENLVIHANGPIIRTFTASLLYPPCVCL
jgi:hypothetical protein